MLRVAYHAQEQMNQLSWQERQDLARVLAGGASTDETTGTEQAGKFVSRFGHDKRVVWSRDDGGDIVVLTVVSRQDGK